MTISPENTIILVAQTRIEESYDQSQLANSTRAEDDKNGLNQKHGSSGELQTYQVVDID